MKLYITYTSTDLKEHGAQACTTAKGLGCDVTNAGAMLSSWDRAKNIEDYDAVLLLLARVYGEIARDTQVSAEESEWDIARAKGIPIGVLLVDPGGKWPLNKIQFETEKVLSLEKFRKKVEQTKYKGFFGEEPGSVNESLTRMLPELQNAAEKLKQITIFVVWDFTIKGLNLILSSLQKRPPNGYQIEVPGLQSQGSSGEIFRDIVLPGILKSDRVLVVTDRPNANVAFEAGLAVGFGKPISLIHFGAKIPEWLESSAFKGFVINSVQDLNKLREVVRNENYWFKQQIAPQPVPSYGPTLFLCPSCYVGSALREEQSTRYPYWTSIPKSGYNLKDLHAAFSNVAQLIWCIAAFPEGADSRDGAENAANGIICGWFYARTKQAPEVDLDKRLLIIRQQNDRDVVDVKVMEEIPFMEIDEFSNRLEDISKYDYRLPKPISLDRNKIGAIKYEIVRIPPLNDNDDEILWVGIYPVTNKQYKEFCEDAKHPTPTYWNEETFVPDEPVVNVSIVDAEKFCKWAGLDLPSREEWEYFTRAGSEQRYWWGKDESLLSAVAWYKDNSEGRIHQVGEKKPNTWGIYDLIGNVWEWTNKYSASVEIPYSFEEREVWKADAVGGAYDTELSELTDSIQQGVEYAESAIGFRCVYRVGSS